MSECTWEPLKNLENIKKMIDDYNKKLNLKDSLKKSSFILMVFFIKIVSFYISFYYFSLNN